MFTKFNFRKVIVTKPLAARRGDDLSVTDRQELLDGHDQKAIQRARVVLIGGGGINGEVAHGLVREGVGHLTIIEHDFVERTNLNRQFFFPRDIGKRKAHCLIKNLAEHSTCGTRLESYAMSLEDAIAAKIDLRGSVAVVGVDNREARWVASSFFASLNVPVIFIAVDLQAEGGLIFVQESGTACFGCAFPKSRAPLKLPCRAPASIQILKAVAGFALYVVDSLLMPGRKRNWNYAEIHLGGSIPCVLKTIPQNGCCPLSCYDRATTK
jgi:molybdopterin/thiamine biosynthesis adenylyltransferase